MRVPEVDNAFVASVTRYGLVVASAALALAAGAAARGTADRAVTIQVSGTWLAVARANAPAGQLATRLIRQSGKWSYVLQGYDPANRYDNLWESDLRRVQATVAKGQPAGLITNWANDHRGISASATVQVVDTRPGQSCTNKMSVSPYPPRPDAFAAKGRVLWVSLPLLRVFSTPPKPTGQCISQTVPYLEFNGTSLTGTPTFTPAAPPSPIVKLPNLGAKAAYRAFTAVVPINVDDPVGNGPPGQIKGGVRVITASYHFANDRQPSGVTPTYTFDFKWDATIRIGVR